MKKIGLILFTLFCFVAIAYAGNVTKVYKDQSGDRLVIADGGTLLVEDGATMTLDNGVLSPFDLTVADTYIIVGNGDAYGVAVDMTGDTSISNTGAVTIATGAVEDSMIEGLALGEIILGVDGTAANNIKATLTGNVTMDATGLTAIAEGAVEDSMFEALAAGEILIGVDGTAANNLITTISGDVSMDATGATLLVSPVIKNVRMRITTAEVNAGHTLLAAVADKGYRMISCKAIAIGGTAATVTTVDVMGDSGGAQVLVAYAVAGLVQSAVLTDGDANSAVLADGVSYIANTDNTAISVIKNGGDMITATHIDIIMSYVLE